MTLGGLALAVGILVDEATVEVENIHTQFEHTPTRSPGRCGSATPQTAVPRLLAMLCILAVFLPSFFMEGAARALFVPLSLAVGFAMVAVYFLSSTFVPVLSVWLLQTNRQLSDPAMPSNRRLRCIRLRPPTPAAAGRLVRPLARWSPATSPRPSRLIWCWSAGQLGTEIFPTVDAGQFQLRLRAPTGTRIERTEQSRQSPRRHRRGRRRQGQRRDLARLRRHRSPPAIRSTPIYLWTGGPEEAVLRVALKPGSGIRVAELKEKLRESIPETARRPRRAVQLRAGRHRQRGHELRRPDAGRDRRQRQQARRRQGLWPVCKGRFNRVFGACGRSRRLGRWSRSSPVRFRRHGPGGGIS